MMLSLLTKRLCPLLSLALTFGCGKKINDVEVTPRQPSFVEGATAESINISVDQSISPFKIYTMTEDLYLNLPSTLAVKTENGFGQKVKITYNLREDNTYEFHCFYESVASATELTFDRCVSFAGREYLIEASDLEFMDFPIDHGTGIKVEILNPTQQELKIQSTFKISL